MIVEILKKVELEDVSVCAEEKEKEEAVWEAALARSLAALVSSKRVRERRGELARKLDLLRRKRDPRPLSKLFRRGLSSKNM